MRLAALIVLAASFPVSAPAQVPKTIRVVLAACDSSDATIKHEQCDRAFSGMYGATIMAEGAPPDGSGYTFCLPLTNEMKEAGDVKESLRRYQEKLLHWLRSHPDTLDQSTFAGMPEGTKALYKCRDTR